MSCGVELIKEIAVLQKEYKKLLLTKKLTKKAMCELVVPFRDKYHLKDREALSIARNEVSMEQIAEMIGETE